MDPHPLQALFLTEGRDLLVRAERDLLRLEEAPDTRASIDAAFRALHSMKGMCATVGLADATDALHAGESLLAAARDVTHLDPAAAAALLTLVHALHGVLDAVEAGRPEPDTLAAQVPDLVALAVVQAQAHARHAPAHLRQDQVPSDAAAAPHRPAPVDARSVRIPAQRLDDLLDLVGELVLARDRLLRTALPTADEPTRHALDDAARLVGKLRDAILVSRLVPLSQVLDRLPRQVRDTAQQLGREVELVVEGRELEVDRSLLDELGEPLLHLVRNAVDHGIEAPAARTAAGKPPRGRVTVRAAREGAMVAITVTDDGAGVDRDRVAASAAAQGVAGAAQLVHDDGALLQLIARPGLSTAGAVTTISGRGVGMDAVLARVQSLGGRLDLATTRGVGTSITLRLPLSVAMLRALLVRVASEVYAIPLTVVQSTHRAGTVAGDGPVPHAGGPGRADPVAGDLAAGHPEEVQVDGCRCRVVSLRSHLGLPPAVDVSGHLVVLEAATGRLALRVDACMAQQEIVVKPMQRVRGAAPLFSGGTILPDGTPSLILDINSLT